jgi:hypothetical protein
MFRVERLTPACSGPNRADSRALQLYFAQALTGVFGRLPVYLAKNNHRRFFGQNTRSRSKKFPTLMSRYKISDFVELIRNVTEH